MPKKISTSLLRKREGKSTGIAPIRAGTFGKSWGFRHALIFLIPAILLAVGIQLYPISYAFYVSLHRCHFLDIAEYVGLENYRKLLSEPETYQAIYKSLVFALGSLLISLSIGLGLALLVNRLRCRQNIFRSFFLLPWSLSQAVVAVLVSWLLNPSYGPVTWVLRRLGYPTAGFLSDPSTAMLCLILTNVWWSVALPMLNFTAALKTIPQVLYDALKIDGGGELASFRHIVLPMIKTTIMSTAIIMSMIYFHMVTLIYVLTGGGPMKLTHTLSVSVFLRGFHSMDLQRAVTMAIALFFITMIFSVAYIAILGRKESIY